MQTRAAFSGAAAIALFALGCSTTTEAPTGAGEASVAVGIEKPAAAEPVAATPPADPDALAADPSLVTGSLPNGLRYVVAEHNSPAGRISVWLHVSSGSLNETEKERGVAHYLEHMAFNGSANFAPGSLVPYFQSLGLAFGRDQNAFTSYDQTTFQLALPDAKAETIGKAFVFLADVASRLSLLPHEIDEERQIILEEKRARGGPQSRVRDLVTDRLAPESTFGRRAPIGTDESVGAMAPEDFREYYGHWYVASNMTVLAVGDCDPAVVVAEVKKAFGAAPTAPKPAPRDIGVKPTTGRRAIVATDPEITGCDVSIQRVGPPAPASTTMTLLRHDLVETIGTRAFDRRMQRMTAAGKAQFRSADASIRDTANAIRITRVHAGSNARQWRRDLMELGAALQRARLHGFTEREVEDVRTALISSAEEAVGQDPTRPSRDVITRMNGVVAAGEPILSAAQRLELLKKLLPGITPAEVSAAFAAAFDPTDAVFVLEMPSKGDVPSEAAFLELCSAAVDVKPEPDVEAPRATTLLAETPAPGEFVEEKADAASGVWSAWLSNGVRVHHKFVDSRKNEATVTISVAGGSILETAEDRGIAEAAAIAWRQPAAGKLSGIDIRDLFVGRKVTTRGGGSEDVLSLTVAGDPAELEEGMKLAYLLLTEPVVEASSFGRWRGGLRQGVEGRRMQVPGLLAETVENAFYAPDEVRKHPILPAQARKITAASAQAWLRSVVASHPIEVAVVGDIDRDAAKRLVATYVGSLPGRPRIGASTFAAKRVIPRPKCPISVDRSVAVKTPEAIVLDGFFGPDPGELTDSRLLRFAARVLSSRMTTTIREKLQLVYSISAGMRSDAVYPGFSTFAAQAPTDPVKGEALAAALEQMYEEFAKDGPTQDEMAVARKLITEQFDDDVKTPRYWLDLLTVPDYRGTDLAQALAARAAYEKFTAAEVKDAFAKYFRPDARFHFVVKPSPEGSAPPVAPAPMPPEGGDDK